MPMKRAAVRPPGAAIARLAGRVSQTERTAAYGTENAEARGEDRVGPAVEARR